MDQHAQLALAKQSFDRLVDMCPPEDASAWHPSAIQRVEYARLGELTLENVQSFEELERRRLLKEGQFQSSMPEPHFVFLREKIRPRVGALRTALDAVDPEGKVVRDLWLRLSGPITWKGRIRDTFETGIDQVLDLIDRNPDWGDDRIRWNPETAFEVMDSSLIRFQPDEWLNRASELAPIRSDKKNFSLPGHVRLRMEEIYRAYVFGLWLSVIGLSRAVLEYSILDNAAKFGIDTTWSFAQGGKPKKLSHLIQEFEQRLPQCKTAMDVVRDCGNEYLHPKASRTSKEALFSSQQVSKEVLERLIDVVECLYSAKVHC